MRIDSTPRRITACAAASFLLHALGLAVWSMVGAPAGPSPDPDERDEPAGDELVYVDIEAPPEAPEAHLPAEAEPTGDPGPPVEPEPIVDPEPPVEPEPIADPDPAHDLDAGLPTDVYDLDAHDRREEFDAAPSDEAAGHDADVVIAYGPDDAGRTAAGTAGDAAAPLAGSPGDGRPAAPVPAGAAADLGRYAPEGDIITVLLRLDRIRATPWEQQVRAILEPMPDYRAIIGGRDIDLADYLDLLVISSFEPQAITATTLAARGRHRAGSLRGLLDHPRAPIAWTSARGGTLGERRPGPAHHPGDPRVYLLPSQLESWLVLARPEHVGALTAPGSPSSSPDDLPAWLRALPDVAAEAGDSADGPMAVVSARGLPDSLRIPRVGVVPAPRHVAMAVEIDPLGFRIRGTLTFESEERAEAFETIANEALPRLVNSTAGRIILRQLHAYNAARGLSFQRVGERVGYATSVSIADGRAALAFAADWTARYFGVAEPASPE